MKQPIVELQIRNRYGRDLIYPINKNAELFATLINKKTLTSSDLKLIARLGFKIEWVPQSLDLKALKDE